MKPRQLLSWPLLLLLMIQTTPQTAIGQVRSHFEVAPPRVMQICIQLACQTLTWRGDHYDAADASGVVGAAFKVVRWDARSIMLTGTTLRPDNDGHIATGVFTADIAPGGDHTVNGKDAWQAGPFHGVFDVTFSWGSEANVRRKAILVRLTQPYTDTGLMVTAGETVSIKARGAMTWYTGGCQFAACTVLTPAGIPCPVNRGDTAPGLPCFSLIGKWGPNGVPFEIGESSIFTAPYSEKLFLGVNDGTYGDNTGLWTAWITISPKNYSGNVSALDTSGSISLAPEGMDAYTGKTVDCNSSALRAASLQTALENGRQDYSSKDYTDGFCWIAKAAQGKLTDALLLYGLGYQLNARTGMDAHEAFTAYLKAAEAGSIYGEFYTGMSYKNGFGIAGDPQMAKMWLDRTAETQEGRTLIAKVPQDSARTNSSVVIPGVLLAIVGALILSADDDNDIYDQSHKHCESTTNYIKNAQQHAAGCKEQWEIIR